MADFQHPCQLSRSGIPSVSSHGGVTSWNGLGMRMRGFLWAKTMTQEEVVEGTKEGETLHTDG